MKKRPTPGGTCLNVGYIPSKTLLHASEAFEETKHLVCPRKPFAAHAIASLTISCSPMCWIPWPSRARP
jgi:pyruvate/2-oxoglutarate dehydrogenase complex dihydrolipoamide dehydrogenase (E3) component